MTASAKPTSSSFNNSKMLTKGPGILLVEVSSLSKTLIIKRDSSGDALIKEMKKPKIFQKL